MPKMTQRAACEGFADPKVPLGPGDIVIIGAGLAGLFTALRLAPLPVTVVATAPGSGRTSTAGALMPSSST